MHAISTESRTQRQFDCSPIFRLTVCCYASATKVVALNEAAIRLSVCLTPVAKTVHLEPWLLKNTNS